MRERWRSKRLTRWIADPDVKSVEFYRVDRDRESDYDVIAEVTYNLSLIAVEELFGR